MKTRIKLNGFLIFVAVMLVAFFPRAFLRGCSHTLLGLIARVAGILLILSGQYLRVIARGYKADNSGNGKLLIQGGPYALTRNPMYLGIFLIGLGMGAAIFRCWVTGLLLAVFVLRYVRLMLSEEKKLAGIFGDSYTAYCQKVPRLFPDLSKLFSQDVRGCLFLKKGWLYKEIGSIIATLSATLLLGVWGVIRR